MSKKLTISVIIIPVLLAAVAYVINPFNTASNDPRLRIVGFAPFKIPAIDNIPTFQMNELVIVNSLAYRSSLPELGDVIAVFVAGEKYPFFKRVYGLPGDTVLIEDAVVYVNGNPIEEPFIDWSLRRTQYSLQMNKIRLGNAELFVLGDNRDNSKDSRVFGPLKVKNILGRVEKI